MPISSRCGPIDDQMPESLEPPLDASVEELVAGALDGQWCVS